MNKLLDNFFTQKADIFAKFGHEAVDYSKITAPILDKRTSKWYKEEGNHYSLSIKEDTDVMEYSTGSIYTLGDLLLMVTWEDDAGWAFFILDNNNLDIELKQ